MLITVMKKKILFIINLLINYKPQFERGISSKDKDKIKWPGKKKFNVKKR